MAGDPITTGLIFSAAAGTTSAVQQLGTAASVSKQQKRSQEVALAQDKKEAAEAEKERRERLRRLLAQQRAQQATSGGVNSALTSNRLLSETNAALVEDRNALNRFRTEAGLGRLNRQVLSSVNQIGGQIGGISRSFLHGGS